MKNDIVLNDKDIDNLFSFVRSKYVRYKDVQYEIVDHLASGMEDLISNDNSLSKAMALDEVYNQFPITGFNKLVQEKEVSMRRYWIKKFYNFLVKYLTLPKLILSVALYLIFRQVLLMAGPFMLYNKFSVSIFFLTMIVLLIMSLRARAMFKNSKDYLVLQTYFISLDFLVMLPLIIIYPLNFVDYGVVVQADGIFGIAASIILTYWTLVAYAMQNVFPDMLVEELNEKYGHLNIKTSLA